MNENHVKLLINVANWYYEDRLGQSEIGRRIGKSRSMVSRLLQEARDSGIVEIQIHNPLIKTALDLEKRLCDTFSLSQAVVLADPPVDYPLLIRRLGELGAHMLCQELRDNMQVGLMWGTTIYEVIWAMPAQALANSTVIQMIGTVGRGNHLIDGPELARSLAQKLNASYCYLPAPIIVEDETIACSFRQQPAIAEVLQQAGQVDVALLGIGTSDDYFSYLEATGYVKKTDLAVVQKAGAVGSILGVFIDTTGQLLDIALNRRVIGFQDFETLQSIPTVIAVAGGAKKAPAILAAMRGGYLDILITDTMAATAVLKLDEVSKGAVTNNYEVLING